MNVTLVAVFGAVVPLAIYAIWATASRGAALRRGDTLKEDAIRLALRVLHLTAALDAAEAVLGDLDAADGAGADSRARWAAYLRARERRVLSVVPDGEAIADGEGSDLSAYGAPASAATRSDRSDGNLPRRVLELLGRSPRAEGSVVGDAGSGVDGSGAALRGHDPKGTE